MINMNAKFMNTNTWRNTIGSNCDLLKVSDLMEVYEISIFCPQNWLTIPASSENIWGTYIYRKIY